MARTITKTLAVIHTERVLHRDIKPDNIYLTADKRIVLIDFGSAHALAAPTGRADLLVSHGYSPWSSTALTANSAPTRTSMPSQPRPTMPSSGHHLHPPTNVAEVLTFALSLMIFQTGCAAFSMTH
ncbi:hypothetical protein ACFSC4_15820 [Deinococcus malanensis]|uniref:protein kinase domain-containing protein n=1 Tax=Deinococcus malanensis TaxID=1706855 RepID=UPI00362623A2